MSDVTVKGFFILQTLKLLDERLSPEDFEKLEADLEIDYSRLNMSYFKDYPVELQNRVEEAAARALWNRTDDDAFYEFGQLSFRTFASSAIGKTLIALVGRNPVRMAKSAGRMLSAVTSGMDIEVKELAEKKISFRFRNNPYRVPGWQGVIEEGIRNCGVEPRTQVLRHGGRDTEYIIEWD